MGSRRGECFPPHGYGSEPRKFLGHVNDIVWLKEKIIFIVAVQDALQVKDIALGSAILPANDVDMP